MEATRRAREKERRGVLQQTHQALVLSPASASACDTDSSGENSPCKQVIASEFI
eukprot:COSAG01_NODE_9690_length_2369_cov_6.698238_2_plen_54_part_00